MQEFADDYYSQKILRESISDWEEISDDDLKLLRSKIDQVVKVPDWDYKAYIIVKDDKPISERVKSVKAVIEAERQRLADEKAKREAKKRDKEKAAMLKKAASEKALLAELKAKYES